jgi:IclR family acetate operon transcriptional repressor
MQPVVRALRVLSAVAESSGGASLQELAETLQLPVSTVHRLIGVLESEKFVIRTTRGKRFLLGPAVQSLLARTSSDLLRRVAEPTMARLNRATGETVFLAELVGKDVICVALSEGTRPLRLSVRLGHALPLHAAAAARVILGWLEEQEAESLLDGAELTRWTPRTITDRKELVRHLALVRERGFDVCDDEMDNHVWAVAAPVRDLSGNVRAALTIVVPLPTVGDAARRLELQTAVLAAAAEISAELGASDDVVARVGPRSA